MNPTRPDTKQSSAARRDYCCISSERNEVTSLVHEMDALLSSLLRYLQTRQPFFAGSGGRSSKQQLRARQKGADGAGRRPAEVVTDGRGHNARQYTETAVGKIVRRLCL